MYIIMPNIFHQQCDSNQFSLEETEVLFSSIHNKLVNRIVTEALRNTADVGVPAELWSLHRPSGQTSNKIFKLKILLFRQK